MLIFLILKKYSGNSLAVQLLGFGVFTAGKQLLGLITGGGTKIPQITRLGKKKKKKKALKKTSL